MSVLCLINDLNTQSPKIIIDDLGPIEGIQSLKLEIDPNSEYGQLSLCEIKFLGVSANIKSEATISKQNIQGIKIGEEKIFVHIEYDRYLNSCIIRNSNNERLSGITKLEINANADDPLKYNIYLTQIVL